MKTFRRDMGVLHHLTLMIFKRRPGIPAVTCTSTASHSRKAPTIAWYPRTALMSHIASWPGRTRGTIPGGGAAQRSSRGCSPCRSRFSGTERCCCSPLLVRWRRPRGRRSRGGLQPGRELRAHVADWRVQAGETVRVKHGRVVAQRKRSQRVEDRVEDPPLLYAQGRHTSSFSRSSLLNGTQAASSIGSGSRCGSTGGWLGSGVSAEDRPAAGRGPCCGRSAGWDPGLCQGYVMPAQSAGQTPPTPTPAPGRAVGIEARSPAGPSVHPPDRASPAASYGGTVAPLALTGPPPVFAGRVRPGIGPSRPWSSTVWYRPSSGALRGIERLCLDMLGDPGWAGCPIGAEGQRGCCCQMVPGSSVREGPSPANLGWAGKRDARFVTPLLGYLPWSAPPTARAGGRAGRGSRPGLLAGCLTPARPGSMVVGMAPAGEEGNLVDLELSGRPARRAAAQLPGLRRRGEMAEQDMLPPPLPVLLMVVPLGPVPGVLQPGCLGPAPPRLGSSRVSPGSPPATHSCRPRCPGCLESPLARLAWRSAAAWSSQGSTRERQCCHYPGCLGSPAGGRERVRPVVAAPRESSSPCLPGVATRRETDPPANTRSRHSPRETSTGPPPPSTSADGPPVRAPSWSVCGFHPLTGSCTHSDGSSRPCRPPVPG
ncbi:hypothetical protein BDV19DRAFT_48411 [Aspergillus venezuelensis]